LAKRLERVGATETIWNPNNKISLGELSVAFSLQVIMVIEVKKIRLIWCESSGLQPLPMDSITERGWLMSRKYWLPVFMVVGWLGACVTANAQQDSVPALESQVVPAGQKSDGGKGNENTTANENTKADHIWSALEKIEAAIRDTIPKVDASKEQRQEYRENTDLNAQQDMALWAKAMFLATVGSVVLTLIGIVLIWRTLHHTSRAADYTKDMVVEAQATTKAANESVLVTRQIGEAQVRAYLRCKSAKYRILKDSVGATLEIENVGQSPAQSVRISGTAAVQFVGGSPSMPRVIAWALSKKKDVDCQPVISGGTIVEQITFLWPFDFSLDGDGQSIQSPVSDFGNELWFDLMIHWSDVFEKLHESPVDLNATIGPSPYDPKRKTSSMAGRLRIRVGDSGKYRSGSADYDVSDNNN
jgi:Domain of unknown function (DUF6471)